MYLRKLWKNTENRSKETNYEKSRTFFKKRKKILNNNF